MPQKKVNPQPANTGAFLGQRVVNAAAAGSRNVPNGLGCSTRGAASSGLSREEVQGLSRFVAGADDLPSIFGVDEGEGVSWEPQKPEEIIADARRVVHERNPRRKEIDDAIFDKPATDRQDHNNRGYHIMLSDNRVRAMDEHFSRRVRQQLLGETVNEGDSEKKPVQSARTPRKPEQSLGKAAKPSKGVNPWYQHPKTWFSNKADRDNANKGGGFPYDGLILKTEGVYGKHDDQFVGEADGARPLAKSEKESLQIVDAYRVYMQGNRLPHFLQ